MTASTITVPVGDEQIEAYLAVPDAPVKGGIVVIHEIWGMQDHFRDIADRFAAQGYVAIAPDVLSHAGIDPAAGAELARLRFEADEEERTREQPRLREAFSATHSPDYTAWAVTALRAVVDRLAAVPGVDGRIAVTGYCFGGGLAFQLAAADDRIKAALPYYGRAPEPAVLAKITVPVLAFYGSLDEPLMATLAQVESDASAAGLDFRAVVYDGARHAFFNDTNATTYDEEAARDSWRQSLDFLSTHLTSSGRDLDALARQHAEQGFVLVKGLLSKEEAAFYRQRGHELLARLNRDDDPTWGSAMGLADGRTRLQHLHDAQFYDAEFSKLMVDPRFTDVAAAVLGVANVQLHHTKLFVKPPENGSPFPLHQDHPFFPHTHHRVGAAIFHFDDAPIEKGCVRVVAGSHLDGPREHDPEGSFHLTDPPFEAATPQPAEAGDVLFFSYLTVHGSGVNTSDEPRTTWLIQYRDPADPPTVKTHDHSLGQGMMLRGIDPRG